jgi:hypothetical protein
VTAVGADQPNRQQRSDDEPTADGWANPPATTGRQDAFLLDDEWFGNGCLRERVRGGFHHERRRGGFHHERRRVEFLHE